LSVTFQSQLQRRPKLIRVERSVTGRFPPASAIILEVTGRKITAVTGACIDIAIGENGSSQIGVKIVS
jgi:hypothetical protein